VLIQQLNVLINPNIFKKRGQKGRLITNIKLNKVNNLNNINNLNNALHTSNDIINEFSGYLKDK
jgi:hypothetical protein